MFHSFHKLVLTATLALLLVNAAPIPAPVPAPAPDPNVVKDFGRGLASGIAGFITSTANAIIHPVATGKGLWAAVTNPGRTVRAIGDSVRECWAENRARCLGSATAFIGTSLATGAALGAVSKSLHTTRLGMIDDVAKTGSKAGATATAAPASTGFFGGIGQIFRSAGTGLKRWARGPSKPAASAPAAGSGSSISSALLEPSAGRTGSIGSAVTTRGSTGGSLRPSTSTGGSVTFLGLGDDFASGFSGATGSIGGSIASLPSATGLGARISNSFTTAASATRQGAANVAAGVSNSFTTAASATRQGAANVAAGVSNGFTAAADATRRGAAKVASGVKTAGGTVLGAPRQIGKTANTLWHAPPITKAGAVGVTAAVSGFVADAAFRGEMMEDNFFF